MIPAQRLYFLLILGIAIAFLLGTTFNPNFSIVITLIYDIVLFGIAIWDGNRVNSCRVKVTRSPLNRLSIGRENPVFLTLESQQKPASVWIKDDFPSEFKVSKPNLKTLLTSNSIIELTYSVNPGSRGEFEWGDLHIRQLSPWQLIWNQWKIPAHQTVAVYPDLVGLRSLSLRLSLENTGTMRQYRRWGMGTEFAELRDYGRGDDTRLIDWKATARHTRPLVRVLEPEKEQTLIILLDRGRLMTAQVQGLKRFDWGLNAALSLALAGLNRGDKVGIGVFDREMITWISPERGQHQLGKFIERLTPIQPVLLEPDYVGAVTQLVNQQIRRSLVVLITDLVDQIASAELLSALSRLTPRYLPFCVTLRDPQIDHIAQNIADNNTGEILTSYRRAVALDLLNQRQIAFAQLEQKGVLVLDAPANQVSEQLVDEYLRLKARSLL